MEVCVNKHSMCLKPKKNIFMSVRRGKVASLVASFSPGVILAHLNCREAVGWDLGYFPAVVSLRSDVVYVV